ncbi:MAG: hypothetical protein Q9191_002964 [Dirinaria sp. TL-2023a]
MDEVSASPPTKIDPYKTLGIPTKASAPEVKTAYKKLALKHHPDKVASKDRSAAHTKFQEIALAYAVLSDEARRARYDTTGSTSESLSDDFNWASFFKAQFAETVTVEKLDQLKDNYQGSDEEKRDILDAYKKYKGNLNKVFSEIMLSNVLDDEARFREIIDGAIAAGEVQGFDAYVKESHQSKDKRRRKANLEAAEVVQHAKDSGVYESVFGDKTGGKKSSLADMIQQRQKERASTFLDDLEAKYGGKGQPNGQNKSKKRKQNSEPPEEAFWTNGAKHKRRKASKDAEELDGFVEEDKDPEPPKEDVPEEAFEAMGARTRKPRKSRQPRKAPKAQLSGRESDAEESLGEMDSDDEEVEEVESEEDDVKLRNKPESDSRIKKKRSQRKKRGRRSR